MKGTSHKELIYEFTAKDNSSVFRIIHCITVCCSKQIYVNMIKKASHTDKHIAAPGNQTPL